MKIINENYGLYKNHGPKTIAIFLRFLSSTRGVCPNCAVVTLLRLTLPLCSTESTQDILPTPEPTQDNLISDGVCLTIASDTAPEAIEVEVHSDHEKQNSDEETVTVDVDVDVGESGESGEVHDLDKENEMNGGNVEKRSNGVVASAGDGCVAKRQRTGMKAEDVEAVGGEDAEAVGGADAEAVGGADAEAVADPVAVAGDGPKRPISEEDEQSVMTGDAKRSRTEKDDMGAPNGSARPVARVLFGPTTIASKTRLRQSWDRKV